jgi:hypothetical protein
VTGSCGAVRKEALDEPRRVVRAGQPGGQTANDRPRSIANHEADNLCRACTKRHAYADFASTTRNGISRHAGDTDKCQQQAKQGEQRQEQHSMSRPRHLLTEDCIRRPDATHKYTRPNCFRDLLQSIDRE